MPQSMNNIDELIDKLTNDTSGYSYPDVSGNVNNMMVYADNVVYNGEEYELIHLYRAVLLKMISEDATKDEIYETIEFIVLNYNSLSLAKYSEFCEYVDEKYLKQVI